MMITSPPGKGNLRRKLANTELGFAVENTLLDKVQLGPKASEHILCLQLNTTDRPVNLLCIYAPTLIASADNKDNFYNQMGAFIKDIPNKEELVIPGDFNANVDGDNDAWPYCLGNFGIGKCNNNGPHSMSSVSKIHTSVRILTTEFP
jgi:hypothetical protein